MEQTVKETKSISERMLKLATQLTEDYERGYGAEVEENAYQIALLCRELEQLATKIMYR